MYQNTHDMIMRQLTIAKETLAELPNAKRDSSACDRLRNQLALALDSIEALVERRAQTRQSAIPAACATCKTLPSTPWANN